MAATFPPEVLHYNYHRNYDPATGRYVESDPIGLAGGVDTYSYVGGNPLMGADSLGLFRVHAGEMYDGTWNYEFEFEPTCIVQNAKDWAFGRGLGSLTKWLRGGRSAGDRLFGPRYSGSNDISDKDARCRCLGYDVELKQYFVARGYSPSAGIAASGATPFSEDGARQMLGDLRRELRRLRREQCATDDCPRDEDAYPWDQLLDLARQRGVPFVGRVVR